MVGFCVLLVNPFGPVQDHVTGIVLVVLAVRLMSLPVQTGLLDKTTGLVGVSLTATSMPAAAEVQLLIVTVTRYLPDPAVVMLVIVGF